MRILTYYGTMAQGQGYSGASEQIALALDRRDDTDVRAVGFNPVPHQNVSQATKKMKSKPFILGEVGLCSAFPNAFSSLSHHKFRVGRTMFETNKIPSGVNDWAGPTGDGVKQINDNVDLLLVPCKHNVKLFRESGVVKPIELAPDGINPRLFNYFDRFDRPKDHVFTFFMHGTLTLRKNPGMVIAAFANLFKDNPNVRLVLKTQSGTLGHIDYVDMGRIEVIDALWSVNDVVKAMQSADVYVFPSRGEGFGIPPLEAMATGLPTIIADNTGMSEYADNRYNIAIPTAELKPARRYPKKWGDVGDWHEPDYHALKEAMRWSYEHHREALEMGKRASEWVLREWTYDRSADKIIRAIEKHYPDWKNGV